MIRGSGRLALPSILASCAMTERGSVLVLLWRGAKLLGSGGSFGWVKPALGFRRLDVCSPLVPSIGAGDHAKSGEVRVPLGGCSIRGSVPQISLPHLHGDAALQ